MEFKGKTCVITGGANGIGRALVEGFVAEGVKVFVIDVDAEKGKQLSHDNIHFFHGNVGIKEDLDQFVAWIKAQTPTIDYLINNACINKGGLLSSCSYDDFGYVLQVGLIAPYYLTSLLQPRFNEGGSIVNIASTRALMSQKNTESYSAAKGGIVALTHAMAISLQHRVRVNAISPGWIDTTNGLHQEQDHSQHPVGRVGKPSDIVAMTLFLCSNKASFITGQNYIIDGGMTKQMIYHHDEGWSKDKKAE